MLFLDQVNREYFNGRDPVDPVLQELKLIFINSKPNKERENSFEN